jgi:LmbE family N-acetylglucosaminyl deacetylase
MTPPISPDPHDVDTEWILAPAGRPAFVYAHQDDEAASAGMIRRVVGSDRRGRFIWWTNGDGLAPMAKMDPQQYARMRIDECSESLRRLGGSVENKVDLQTSEIEVYRRLSEIPRGGRTREEHFAFFEQEARRVEAAVRAADPDRVFTLAWQGGHPEHDLIHLMVVRAVRRLRRETGRPIPVIQSPAYEYVIACALRFNPFFKGDRRSIRLSGKEYEAKRKVFEAYPSQEGLFQKFRRIMNVLGVLSTFRLRPFTHKGYIQKEEFGVVDPDLDYHRSTHTFEFCNYMFDDFEGVPIRFDAMIRPLVDVILG